MTPDVENQALINTMTALVSHYSRLGPVRLSNQIAARCQSLQQTNHANLFYESFFC